ncbi:hypothetical protein I4F81_005625 [Pyropia yezoensis]|uniref:Uncharacterized protein n=1 Tax=Pyropia yezoensis TaxID=2788 RepID=A0ACC3BZX3_PYRYE|nr:hypothetical protein I4F81_005625 [Neopyropia yezoensis]
MALLDPGAVVGGASPLLEASFGGGPRPPSLPPPPHNESADGVAATIDGRIGGGSALRSGDTAVLIDTPPVPGDPSPGWSAGATATDGGNGEDAFRQYFWRPDMDGLRPMGEHQAAVLARQEAFIGRLAALLVRLTLAGVAVQVAGLRSLSRAQAIEFGLEWEREDGVEGYVVVVDAAGTHAAAARLY